MSTLANFAQELAAALGEGWTVSDRTNSWTKLLEGPKSQRLWVSEAEGQAKYTIAGDLPRRQDNSFYGLGAYEKLLEINVSASKSAEKIANEIKRRLFPSYLPLLERALTYQEQDKAQARAMAANVARMEAGGLSRSTWRENQLHGTLSGVTVKADVYSTTVHLDLSWLTPDQAEAIIALLKEAR